MNPLPAAGSQTAPGWADKPARWNGKGQPRMGFFTDTSICIGCKACEVACKEWNQVPEDGLDFLAMSYDNTGALGASTWRHVAFIEQRSSEANGEPGIRWLMSSDVCKHCTSAACLEVCPTGALIRTEFGTVVVQEDVCNGCGYCVPACPFGVIDQRQGDGRVWKCTLCYDRLKGGLEPACAKACPTGSIQFGPLAELRERARRRVEELHRRGVPGACLYGDAPTATYSGLNSFYLLVDRPSVYGLPDEPFNPWLHMGGDYVRALVAALAAVALLVAVFLILGH